MDLFRCESIPLRSNWLLVGVVLNDNIESGLRQLSGGVRLGGNFALAWCHVCEL